MEPFKVYILGCGSALPTLRHQPSSQIVEIRGKMMMVDCGEGTQIHLRRSHIAFTRISNVFISHLHGDHCLGLIGMISTFGLLKRQAPLNIYAPAHFEELFKTQMEMFCNSLDYEVIFHPIDTTCRQVIFEDRSLTIETIPLEHRVPCAGFLFREKPGLPHIKREMIEFYKIPVSQINNIKNGADWVDEDGNTIPNKYLVEPADPVRSYAYCSDTRYMPELYKVIQGVNVLYHESTYDKKMSKNAKLYYHSTAEDAARVALKANVGTLLLGHYSARYEDENVLLQEALKFFPNTLLSKENMVFDVK